MQLGLFYVKNSLGACDFFAKLIINIIVLISTVSENIWIHCEDSCRLSIEKGKASVWHLSDTQTVQTALHKVKSLRTFRNIKRKENQFKYDKMR